MSGDSSEDGAKAMVTLNWLLDETVNVDQNFSLRILEYILLGMPASPLRKALIDSGLGEDLAGGGLEPELRQMCFSTGLKGIKPGDADKVEDLVLKTLETLARSGIDPHTVEAALNTIEFRLRENNTGSFPRGLSLMLRSLTTWLYDGDPLSLVAFEAPLSRIRKKISETPSYFENLIEQAFLKNSHRTTVLLKPDPDLREETEKKEKERLDKARSVMDDGAVKKVLENTRELKRLQETPDTPEALATIPTLKLADLETQNKSLPLTELEEKGIPILYHDLFTNGIVYVDLGFDLNTLPAEYLPYVPLLGRAFLEMGTQKEDFVTLSQRISRKTGGIHPQAFTSDLLGHDGSVSRLFLRAKAMVSQSDDLMGIFKDVLLTPNFDDRDRFRRMVMEEKSRMEQKLIPSGHQMVNLRIRSHFTRSHWAAEQLGGVSYLFFVRKLAEKVEKDWPSVVNILKNIYTSLVNRSAVMANVTVDDAGWKQTEPGLRKLLSDLPERSPVKTPDATTPWPSKTALQPEAMTIPSQVNYVGKGLDLKELGWHFHGSVLAITRYLRNSMLWDQVRVQGGAYGAFCLLDRISGVLTFVSYRDPNLMETLNVFDRSAAFLKENALSDSEVTKSIIGAIGDLDSHMLPDTKGFVSMSRHLTGDSDALRQQMREELLGTTAADFKAMGEILREVAEKGVVKVLGSETAAKTAEAQKPEWLKRVKVM